MSFYDFIPNNDVVEAYNNRNTAPHIFPVVRTISATAYQHNGVYYFKTREIADLLSIKQPFQFNSAIKKKLGEQVIISGQDTVLFRDECDNDKTTFISASNLQRYLSQDKNISELKMGKDIINNLDMYI